MALSRKHLLLWQVAFLLFLILTLYFGRHPLQQLVPSSILPAKEDSSQGDHNASIADFPGSGKS